MLKAYKTVSAVLSPEEFKTLGWGRSFVEDSKRHRKIASDFLVATSYSEYYGIRGLMKYAGKLELRSLKKVRRLVQVALSKSDFASLD